MPTLPGELAAPTEGSQAHFSSTTTLAPFAANWAAVESPPMPLPMMTASYSMSVGAPPALTGASAAAAAVAVCRLGCFRRSWRQQGAASAPAGCCGWRLGRARSCLEPPASCCRAAVAAGAAETARLDAILRRRGLQCPAMLRTRSYRTACRCKVHCASSQQDERPCGACRAEVGCRGRQQDERKGQRQCGMYAHSEYVCKAPLRNLPPLSCYPTTLPFSQACLTYRRCN